MCIKKKVTETGIQLVPQEWELFVRNYVFHAKHISYYNHSCKVIIYKRESKRTFVSLCFRCDNIQGCVNYTSHVIVSAMLSGNNDSLIDISMATMVTFKKLNIPHLHPAQTLLHIILAKHVSSK